MNTVVSAFVRRRRARAMPRLLALRRAWQQIADGPDPDIVTRLSEQVSHVELNLPGWLLRLAGVPASVCDQVEVCVRQYLLTVTLYSELQPSVLLAATGRPTAIAAPRRWRAFLATKGLAFESAASSAAFGWLVARHGVRGLGAFWRILSHAARGRLRDAPSQPYDVLVELPPSLLSSGGNGPTQSLVGWYAARANGAPVWLETSVPRAANLPSNCTPCCSALPRLNGWRGHLRFTSRVARFVVAALIGVSVGRWQLLLVLRDLVQLAHARGVGPAALARCYTSDNSSWIHRPLFTVWAEREAGCRAELLFYSTNCDESLRLQPNLSPPTFLPGYRIMSWSHYLVWDRYQADLVAAWGHDANRAVVVGNVPLTDSDAAIPALPERCVAVFDVTPFKPARLAQLGLVPAYYNGAVGAAFLRDTYSAVRACGGTLVLKQKREMGHHAHWRYRQEAERLRNCSDVIVLDPGISARRLVEVCGAVICMPFSSPGLFAEGTVVPVAFYDPTARVIASPRQRHGLSLLLGKQHLTQWLFEQRRADPSDIAS